MVVEIDTKVVLECRFFFGITVYMALELGLTCDFLPPSHYRHSNLMSVLFTTNIGTELSHEGHEIEILVSYMKTNLTLTLALGYSTALHFDVDRSCELTASSVITCGAKLGTI